MADLAADRIRAQRRTQRQRFELLEAELAAERRALRLVLALLPFTPSARRGLSPPRPARIPEQRTQHPAEQALFDQVPRLQRRLIPPPRGGHP